MITRLLDINWTELTRRKISTGNPFQFHGCNMSHSTFFGMDLKNILIFDCLAKNVDFRETDLSSANFKNTDLSESKFSGTNLSKVDFTSASNYNISIERNNIKKAKFSLPEAMSLLYNLDIEIL